MEKTSIVIEQLTKSSIEDIDAIRNLAAKLGSGFKSFTSEDMAEILSSPNLFLLVARDQSTQAVIGMVTVCIYRIPYVRKAYLDDFIVDENYRGQGVGTKLFKKALDLAKEKKATYADFTSNPKRIESNKLYEKLGFKQRDTNVYRLVFDYGEV